MTATLDDVTKKIKAEPSAEQLALAEGTPLPWATAAADA